jgi:4-hydroxy-2-oxoglutarate aldolase
MKESGSDLALISEFIARTPESFTVLAGSATTFFLALCTGCHGAILALAAIVPEACVRLRELVRRGDLEEARRLQRDLMPIARSVGSVFGVAGLKAALDLLGYEGGSPRLPLQPAPPRVREQIRAELEEIGALASVRG